jgi:hypothetical protein
MTCIFCDLDAHEASEDDRRMAYYIVGAAGEDNDVAPCGLHKMCMVTGLSVLAAVTGFSGEAKQIRAIATVREVPTDPSGRPDG